MKTNRRLQLLSAFIALLFSAHIAAQPVDPIVDYSRAESYSDSHGGKVRFPQGDVSFADEVMFYRPGNPAPLKAKHKDPSNALSVPDYKRRTGDGYVSLGCGGMLVVKFNDNALVDIDGPDLHIFEVGTAIEPTQLEISPDNKQWIMIGEISGGRADIDISNYTQQFDLFRYLRLTDLKQHCGAGSPGSDIDAIGAIGSALQLTLDSGVIFGFNQSLLTTAARTKLDEVIAQIQSYPRSKITVAGHTDNQGADDYNMQLSLQRAQAVSDYISRHLSLSRASIEAIGYGEESPIADNDSKGGQQKNRRVEITVIPVSRQAL
ncbi:MAG: OmpA family protein [Gammaproteobacteria bacterium]|nr:OmpA family protein [Gammaproteobacteria bacterium]